MTLIMQGHATPAQIAALLMGLKLKGETIAEISGAAKVMRSHAEPVVCRKSTEDDPLVDVVGTGGDTSSSFNVSTTTAFVLAGAGLRVAKHGNRAVSGKCGSADLLEALGVRLGITAQELAACVDEVGIGFLYAPPLHPALGHAMPTRREMGVRTIFNLLGPLTNPARARVFLIGVYEKDLILPLARVIGRLGAKKAYVVYGQGGYDEVTLTGPTYMAFFDGQEVKQEIIEPNDLGLKPASPESITCQNPRQSKETTLLVLNGEPGPARDMVLMNAAVALKAAGKARDFKQGLEIARQAIDQGKALLKLHELVRVSNQRRLKAV
jgi:anthranilate phosphoribosyltransferase